jgi:ketosteroid isomerase-like protein
MRVGLPLIAGTVLIVAACNFSSSGSATASSTSSSIADQSAALMQTSRDWAKAAQSGDVERTLSYWADDAVVMQADQPTYSGKKSIRGMVESSMKIPKFSITWEPERAWVSPSGDVGYLIEHNRISFADSTGKVRTQFGKGVTIWRKDAAGNWKCVVDAFNANPTETALPAGA